MELLCKFIDIGSVVCWLILIFEWSSNGTVYYGTSLVFMYMGLMAIFYGIINYKNEKA